jgi:hypothetical protein
MRKKLKFRSFSRTPETERQIKALKKLWGERSIASAIRRCISEQYETLCKNEGVSDDRQVSDK